MNSIDALRIIIREEIHNVLVRSREHSLADDQSYSKKSVLVPDDIKDSVDVWMSKMGLCGVRGTSK